MASVGAGRLYGLRNFPRVWKKGHVVPKHGIPIGIRTASADLRGKGLKTKLVCR